MFSKKRPTMTLAQVIESGHINRLPAAKIASMVCDANETDILAIREDLAWQAKNAQRFDFQIDKR